jgi:hypothetical protein
MIDNNVGHLMGSVGHLMDKYIGLNYVNYPYLR